MKRPHQSHPPGRADARTTWSKEAPAGPPDHTAADPAGSAGRWTEGDAPGALLARSVWSDRSVRTPPLPGPPLPLAVQSGSELDPGAASVRASQLLDRLADGDDDTAGHLRRTAATVKAVATSLGWDDDRVRWTTFGALLHDIGKIGVAPQVMLKPGPLSESEQAAMRDHVIYGTQVVTENGFPPLVARIVQQHHERLDGSGYPAGLRGAEICEEARLVMLADIADAMLSRRAYKRALSMHDVRSAFSAGAGLLFDPALVGPVVAELAKHQKT